MDTLNQIFEAAVELHRKNDLINAEKKYREYLRAAPKDSQCLFVLGTLLIQKKQYKDAIIQLKNSSKADSKNYHCFQNLGIAYFEDNQFTEAIDAYTKSISLNDKNADAYNNLGNALHQSEKFDEAILSFNEAIKIWRNDSFVLNRAKSYHSALKYIRALEDLDTFAPSSPFYREVEDIRATICDTIGHPELACPIYEDRLKNYKNYDPAYQKTYRKEYFYMRLIRSLKASNAGEKEDKAIAEFEKEFPNNDNINRLNAQKAYDERRFEDAISLYSESLKRNPKSAATWQNIAVAYQNLGDFESAKFYLKKCLSLNKTSVMANVGFGILLLKEKKFKQAWPHYEYRLLTEQYRNHSNKYILYNTKLPKWDGSNGPTNIIIYGEQGVGDQLCLAKLLTKIKNFRNQFTILVDKRLIPILERSFPSSNFVFADHKIGIEGFFDYQAAIFRLGFLFVDSENDIKDPNKFLLADKPNKFLLADKSNTTRKAKLRCGVSWYSGNAGIGYMKNIELKDLIKASNSDNDFDFINLQYGDHESDIIAAEESNNVQINRYDDLDKFNDLEGLFNLVESCDVVITISNITAHIAGSLGKKTYLILSAGRGQFWYWMKYKETNKSLWYPSIEMIQSENPLSVIPALDKLQTKLKNISI